MLTDKSVELKQYIDSCRRMYADALLVAYNNILNKEDYKYCVHICLKQKKGNAHRYCNQRLAKHYESINWFIKDAKNSICFAILGIDKISIKSIKNSILRKFNSNCKFIKSVDDILKGMFR